MMGLRTKQQGFTLLELAVVIAILSILAAAYMFADPGSRSKAVAMNVHMTELGNSMARAKTDTGCYPMRLDALFNQALNVAGNIYCGLDVRSQWRGPYIKPFTVDGSNNENIDKISAGGTVSIDRQGGGIGQQYYLRANNIPNDLIKQAVAECNGTDINAAIPTTFAGNKCRAVLGAGAVSIGTFDLMFDETP